MEISEINIQTLLPQQHPFVMIDRLLHYDAVVTRTDFRVLSDNLFFSDGVLVESGIIENIAQTCAARMGYISSVINPGEIRIGFIGAIKNLNIYRLPKMGELLDTQVNIQNEVFNITVMKATVKVNSEIIADCEMKISLQ